VIYQNKNWYLRKILKVSPPLLREKKAAYEKAAYEDVICGLKVAG